MTIIFEKGWGEVGQFFCCCGNCPTLPSKNNSPSLSPVSNKLLVRKYNFFLIIPLSINLPLPYMKCTKLSTFQCFCDHKCNKNCKYTKVPACASEQQFLSGVWGNLETFQTVDPPTTLFLSV